MKPRTEEKPAARNELEQKYSELASLRARHAEALTALQMVRDEIAAFETAYERNLGWRMVELERLEEEISRLTGYGGREGVWEKFSSAARDSGFAKARGAGKEREGRAEEREEKEIKSLYREVAKAIHPDLGASPAEIDRNELMSRANRAYAAGDRKGLQEILRKWQRVGEPVSGGDLAGELARVIRSIHRERGEIEAVNAKVAELRGSYLCRFKLKVDTGKARGSDLFAEMVAAADLNLARARKRLAALKGETEDVTFGRQPSGEAENVTFRRQPAEGRQGVFRKPSGPSREICFPEDFSGTLYLRDRTSQNFTHWRKAGPARGCLKVGADQAVRLDLEGDAARQFNRVQTLKDHDLQSLFLYGAGDEDLDGISRLAGLEELYLCGPKLTDAALSRISRLSNLKRIYLYQTVITDRGLAHLHHLPRLSGLTSSGNGITDEGLATFRMAVPGVKTVSFPWNR